MSGNVPHDNCRPRRFHWLVLGLLAGLTVAALMPETVLVRPPFREVPRPYYDMWRWQQRASHLFWYSMLGVALGIVVDLAKNPPKSFRFRFTLRGLLVFVLTVAMFLSACSLYIRIMAIRP